MTSRRRNKAKLGRGRNWGRKKIRTPTPTRTTLSAICWRASWRSVILRYMDKLGVAYQVMDEPTSQKKAHRFRCIQNRVSSRGPGFPAWLHALRFTRCLGKVLHHLIELKLRFRSWKRRV